MKAEKLLEIANMAWAEVLKEKIKEHIKNSDSKIDQLAKKKSAMQSMKYAVKILKINSTSFFPAVMIAAQMEVALQINTSNFCLKTRALYNFFTM